MSKKYVWLYRKHLLQRVGHRTCGWNPSGQSGSDTLGILFISSSSSSSSPPSFCYAFLCGVRVAVFACFGSARALGQPSHVNQPATNNCSYYLVHTTRQVTYTLNWSTVIKSLTGRLQPSSSSILRRAIWWFLTFRKWLEFLGKKTNRPFKVWLPFERHKKQEMMIVYERDERCKDYITLWPDHMLTDGSFLAPPTSKRRIKWEGGAKSCTNFFRFCTANQVLE